MNNNVANGEILGCACARESFMALMCYRFRSNPFRLLRNSKPKKHPIVLVPMIKMMTMLMLALATASAVFCCCWNPIQPQVFQPLCVECVSYSKTPTQKKYCSNSTLGFQGAKSFYSNMQRNAHYKLLSHRPIRDTME